jgi:hypothetical protein
MFQTLIDPAFLAFENGGTPVLDLNFAATKELDSRITFTRASVGTFVDSTGALQTASSGAARFTHDPVTLRSLGLMIEGSRTNLLLNSATLSTQNVTTTAAAHTLHFTGTGTITLTGTSTAGPLVGTGTGEANRVSLTFTPTAGTLTLTVSGTVTNAQLEVGGFKTSYIPTTGATVQRAAESAVMTGTNFSAWYNQSQGTIALDAAQGFAIPSSTFLRLFDISNSTATERISAFTTSASSDNVVYVQAATGGSTFAEFSPAGALGPGPFKIAISYSTAAVSAALNGNAATSDTTVSAFTPDRLTLGASVTLSSNSTTIARFRFFNRALATSVQVIST